MAKILVTGGAGFIGSNLIDRLLELKHQVVCLDNLSTGYEKNINHHYGNPNFQFINGDIRDLEVCRKAVKGCNLVSHQAALGSVPRSIEDPILSNSVNVDGFLNVLVAARDEGIKRFVYAASSSTYGDSEKLPKVEHEIGRPLSPYAVTKYVNELYADVFARTYGMQCIGLRYFNVFGKRQDPNGTYAAVIPLWVKQLINHERPVINGDGSYSRDFTYVENVVHANIQALFVSAYDIWVTLQLETVNDFKSSNEDINFAEVFNIAFGGNTTLLQLYNLLQKNLAKFDPSIYNIEPFYGLSRKGDIPHSQANILKAQKYLNYQPAYDVQMGITLAAEWYFNSLK